MLGGDGRNVSVFGKCGTQQLSKPWDKLELFVSFIGKVFTKDTYDDL